MPEIVHVVLVEWRDNESERTARAEAIIDERLPRIMGVEALERGRPARVGGLEDGFHWMFVTRFRDMHALDAYGPNADHQILATYIHDNARRVVVFDIAASASVKLR